MAENSQFFTYLIQLVLQLSQLLQTQLHQVNLLHARLFAG